MNVGKTIKQVFVLFVVEKNEGKLIWASPSLHNIITWLQLLTETQWECVKHFWQSLCSGLVRHDQS